MIALISDDEKGCSPPEDDTLPHQWKSVVHHNMMCRSMAALGQNPKSSNRANVFRSSPNSGPSSAANCPSCWRASAAASGSVAAMRNPIPDQRQPVSAGTLAVYFSKSCNDAVPYSLGSQRSKIAVPPTVTGVTSVLELRSTIAFGTESRLIIAGTDRLTY
jgi:hypothetical protein